MKKITKILDSVMSRLKRTCVAKAIAVFAVATIAMNSFAQEETITGVKDLAGKNLAYINSNATTDGKYPEDMSKMYFLYNEKTGKFLNLGSYWGTHVALADYGKPLWVVKGTREIRLASNKYQTNNVLLFTHNMSTTQDDNQGPYVGWSQVIDSKPDEDRGVYADRKNTATSIYGWELEFTGTDKNTCKLKTKKTEKKYGVWPWEHYCWSDDVYLCGVPASKDPNRSCEAYSADDIESKGLTGYDTWRIMTYEDIYNLQHKNTENMTTALDLSFKLKASGFPRGASDLTTGWTIKSYSTQTKDGEAGWYFGLHNKYTKVPNIWDTDITIVDKFHSSTYEYKFNGETYKRDDNNLGGHSKAYERELSKFHSASVKSVRGLIWQDVEVTQSGTYQIECKGISTTPKAVLFAGVKDPENPNQMLQNRISKQVLEQTSGMSDAEKMALGVIANTTDGNEAFNVDYAGKEFYTDDKYFNSVQVKVDVPENGTRTIRFGILIGQKNDEETPAADEWTVFDDFRLLFISKTINQDLVLDEYRDNLKYLIETTNTYKNVSLHLNKTFTQNKWNTFVLPVDLTASQIRKAFGADTRLAKLSKFTGTAIEFASVDLDNTGGKPAMEAYMPYIIFPSGGENDVISPIYTAVLEKSDGTKEEVKIAANHYVIPSVTVPTKTKDGKEVSDWSKMSNDNSTSLSMESTDGKMKAIGTFARTFGDATQNDDGTWNITNKDKILDRRDNLKGSYFFDNGKMYHSKDRARGLRGFSCWFKPTTNSDQTPAPDAQLTIDGVTQSGTTGIEDILADYEQPVSRFANGIYNLNGQLVKQGNSTAGLPSGMYIVNGKKCIVR